MVSKLLLENSILYWSHSLDGSAKNNQIINLR